MKRLSTATPIIGMWLADSAAIAAAPTSADQIFVAKVSQGGMFEVEAGKLAATKANAIDVRDFATAETQQRRVA